MDKTSSRTSDTYANEEIKRIHEEANRKEKALIDKFSLLQKLARDALFSNMESTIDHRVQRFEEILS